MSKKSKHRRDARRAGRAPATAAAPPPKLDYQNYMIGFLDSLGQSELLQRFRLIQETDAKALEELHAAVQHIHHLRRLLALHYEKAEEPSGLARLLPESERKQLRGLRRGAGYYRAFSDSLLLFVPVNGEDELLSSVLGVWRSVMAGAAFLTASLADGKPMRGGMDIALGVDLSKAPGGVGCLDGEIYGPALLSAYTLESKVAKYPRIVVGEAMCWWLESITQVEELRATADGRTCFEFAKRTLALLTVDGDGRHVIDFMGQAMRDIGALPAFVVDAVYKFALAQKRRAEERKSEELVRRYTCLLEYCRPRLALWGIAA